MAIKIKTDTAPDERKKSTENEGLKQDAPRAESQSPSSVDTPSRTFRTRAPNGTFDRKEYNKIYQRAYRKHQRAKKKAEQENASE